VKRVLVSTLSLLLVVSACLTTRNRPTIAARADVPPLEGRAPGCNIEMLEDGTPPTRPHLDIADVTLEWPRDKVADQGPAAAMETLKQAGCENGAFIVHGIRALTTGSVESGLIYEATFATLLGDDGKPVNLKADPAQPKPGQVLDDAAASVADAAQEASSSSDAGPGTAP
jgi:hypothetical protein